jgi:hypothetical protein
MSDKDREGRTSRRDFLRLASVGASAAGAAAITTTGAEAEEKATELGYRKSDHVKAYLDSCRF